MASVYVVAEDAANVGVCNVFAAAEATVPLLVVSVNVPERLVNAGPAVPHAARLKLPSTSNR